MWWGKGEATDGSEGLKKSELKPRRLGEARPENVTLVGEITGSLLLKLLAEDGFYILTARALNSMFTSIWRLGYARQNLWMKLDSESDCYI